MAKILLSILLIIVLCDHALAWPAKVVGVHDGDSVTVLRNGYEQVKIRLYGIDAPELKQPFGKAAKKRLRGLVFGKVVDIEPMDTDRYGRTVALVFDESGDVNAEMVRSGLAWVYRKYCNGPRCWSWLELERDAREYGIGLWSDGGAVPPWGWRKARRAK